jgi:hypothetical protein
MGQHAQLRASYYCPTDYFHECTVIITNINIHYRVSSTTSRAHILQFLILQGFM